MKQIISNIIINIINITIINKSVDPVGYNTKSLAIKARWCSG